ncbi:hypothetical protein RCE11_16595 [Klebsiella pneumoniae]|nr:hypothetical protein [Klebsiella pneumoniae]
MMSLWDALRMNMMISYQELVRTFPSKRYHLLNFKFIFFTPPGKRRRRTDLSFPLVAMAQSAVASYRVFILPASRCAEINENNARAEE